MIIWMNWLHPLQMQAKRGKLKIIFLKNSISSFQLIFFLLLTI